MTRYGISFSVLALLLSGCGSVATVEKSVSYTPQTQARIRLYGQNQKPTIMRYGIDCAAGAKGEKIGVGNSFSGALGSMVGAVENESIGIAPTATSQNLSDGDGILSKVFFQEFVIPAGKAVNVQAAYLGLTTVNSGALSTTTHYEGSCESNLGSFIPEAGKDYEVIGERGKSCGVSVYQIDVVGAQTLVPLDEGVKCN